MKFLRSKLFAWCAFALVIIFMGITFSFRPAWWAFIDLFFLFMASFINLCAVMIQKINPLVSQKLNPFVLIFLILFVIAFLGEWLAYNYL